MQWLSLPLALSLLSLPTTAQTTWTVDDDGPADFTDIQLAVDAASDGDRILVREGTYSNVAIDGKGLTIQADGDATLSAIGLFVPASTVFRVDNLAADQVVSVRGFLIQMLLAYDERLIELRDNAGAILFEDCVMKPSGYPVEISDCASVTMSRCDIQAPPTYVSIAGQFFLGILPYNAIISIDSNLFLYDSVVVGSQGSTTGGVFGSSVEYPPGDAGNGLVQRGGTLFASSTRFQGLDGGLILDSDCYAGADGGAGIVLESSGGTPAVARLIDSPVIAGSGSFGTCGEPAGDSPPPIEVISGTVEQLPGAARSFEMSSPVVESTQVDVAITAQPGDAATIFFSLEATNGAFLPVWNLAGHLAVPFGVLPVGQVPGSGLLEITYPLPPLPPGLGSFQFVAQAVTVDAQVMLFDGGPSTLMIVNASL